MATTVVIKNKMLDAIFGEGDPANYFWGFSTQAPALPNATGEIADADYDRVSVANDATNFPPAANGIKANGVRIEFTLAAADYPADVTHIFIATAATGNNLIASIALDTPLTVTAGKGVEILAGDAEIEITDLA